MKTYIIHGDPIPLARARLGNNKKIYDCQKHIKLIWGINLSRIHGDNPKFKGPIFLDAVFYFPIPKSKSKLKYDKTISQWHYFRPDADNLIKFICDVATDICYDDDCIIAKLSAQKLYDDGNGARTEFTIGNLTER